MCFFFFFFSSRRRHTRWTGDWSSDVCSSDLQGNGPTLLECKTVRWERHSAISSGKYQNEEEATKWKRVDPIPRLEKALRDLGDRKSTRLNSSHPSISYAVFCLKKKKTMTLS